jgi:hypothetical protein
MGKMVTRTTAKQMKMEWIEATSLNVSYIHWTSTVGHLETLEQTPYKTAKSPTSPALANFE